MELGEVRLASEMLEEESAEGFCDRRQQVPAGAYAGITEREEVEKPRGQDIGKIIYGLVKLLRITACVVIWEIKSSRKEGK